MGRWLRQDVTMRRWLWLLLVAVAIVAGGSDVFGAVTR